VVPPRLRALVDEWYFAGSPEPDGIAWPRQRWATRFPSHAQTFEALPTRLTRPVVRRACQDAAASPVTAERAFLTVMVGVRAGRVRPLPCPAGAGNHPRCRSDPPIRRRRASQRWPSTGIRAARRPRCGPAARPGPGFRHQVPLLLSPPGTCPALILDRLVADWLSEHAGLRLNQIRWSASTYLRYLTSMSGWADEMALPADKLEACIFMAAAADIGGQWT
jgi:hypothetical protein